MSNYTKESITNWSDEEALNQLSFVVVLARVKAGPVYEPAS